MNIGFPKEGKSFAFFVDFFNNSEGMFFYKNGLKKP
jgi:uncharacterized protein (DUF2164 family)